MSAHFVSTIEPPTKASNSAFWFIFKGNELLVEEKDEAASLLTERPSPLSLIRQHYLGYLETDPPAHCFAAEIAEDEEAPAGMAFLGLRRLYGRLPEPHLWLAGRGVQIIDWDRTHLYCGRCGAQNELLDHERAKKCPNCGLITYPRISPAVIVRVDRFTADGPRLLLARNHRFRRGWFSVLAGFVEPGETLEACVRREIKEEVGINVKNIRYFGSQPWPFPNSLMIAYTAEYADGELELEEEEIAEAHWFAADDLPNIPSKMSISRRLIDDFINRHTG